MLIDVVLVFVGLCVFCVVVSCLLFRVCCLFVDCCVLCVGVRLLRVVRCVSLVACCWFGVRRLLDVRCKMCDVVCCMLLLLVVDCSPRYVWCVLLVVGCLCLLFVIDLLVEFFSFFVVCVCFFCRCLAFVDC